MIYDKTDNSFFIFAKFGVKIRIYLDEFGENVYPLPRNEIQELQEHGPAKTLRSVLEKVKQKIHENFVLDFQKKKWNKNLK